MSTNNTDQQQVPVIAWRLTAPSSSGGKVYTIAVHGSTVITAWGKKTAAGSHDAGSRFKELHCTSPDHAIAQANRITEAKLAAGYKLGFAPRVALQTVTGRDPLLIASAVLRDGEPA